MHLAVLALFAISGSTSWRSAMGDNPIVNLALPSQAPVYIFLNNNFAGEPVLKRDGSEDDGIVSGTTGEIGLGEDQKVLGSEYVEGETQVKTEETTTEGGEKTEVQTNTTSSEVTSFLENMFLKF